MCTEPGSEQTVTQVENLIVVQHIEEHDGQATERQKHPDGMGTAVLPGFTGENHVPSKLVCMHACVLPVETCCSSLCGTAWYYILLYFCELALL